MSQLANCPLTEATLDRIATVESRLAIAPPNPLIRQMILLQLGFLIALISGVVCLMIGIGLTVGLRYVSDQAGRLWKQHEFQVEQDKARKAYEAETGKAHPEPLSLQEQFAALEAKHAKEEAAAKQQAEAARLQEEEQTETLRLEAERLNKLQAEQQGLDAQRAEAARLKQQEAESRRLLQQQSSQVDPEMSRSYSTPSPAKTLTSPPVKPKQATSTIPSAGLNESQLQALTGTAQQAACKRYIHLMETDTLEKKMARPPARANIPDGMNVSEFSYYYGSCLPMQQGGKL